MSSFLNLPYELRSAILEFAITSSQAAPELPDEAGKRIQLNDIEYRSPFRADGIFYPSRMPRTNPRSLLLVNNQIRAETLDVMRRLPKDYHLDLMLVREHSLYPTWTFVPPLRADRRVNLNMTIRIIGAPEHSQHSQSNGFVDTMEGAGTSIWDFYSLLERTLRYGAGSLLKEGNLVWNTLHIDIKTPAVQPDDGLAPEHIMPHEMPEYRYRAVKDVAIHPTSLYRLMKNWFIALLENGVESLRTEGYPDYGVLFLDRLQSIQFSLDGEKKDLLETERFVTGERI